MAVDDMQTRRAAYDRRQRAWVFTVLGALGAWLSLALASQGGAVGVIGWVGFLAGVAATVYGLTLFTSRRP